MNNAVHFLNGKFVTENELLISPRDLGFIRGYAVTDFLVTHNHKPFKLSDHIDRLFKSAKIIGLKIPWNKTQIENWIKKTLDKNNIDSEKSIKIILSGGNSHSMYQTNVPTIVFIIDNHTPPPPSYYEKGVKVNTVKYKRPYPESKHTYYVEAIKQLSDAQNDNVVEVVYYDESQVYEGAGSNLFAVIKNKLVTTKTNIVEGITRNILLKILKLPIPIEAQDFTIDDLFKANEIFLTGSSKGVRGVIEINGNPVGDGKVGKITKEVAKQYKEYIYETNNT